MRRKIVVLMAIVAVAMGVSLFAAPSVSQAVPIINTVTVTIGAFNFTLWGSGLPADLGPTGSLTLAQTSGFNFDTSDLLCAGGSSGATNCPNPTVTINGQVFTDTTKVLTINNKDPLTSTTFNESINYVPIGTSSAGDFQVFVAYFDNLHSNACGSGITSPLTGNPTCTPSPLFFSGGGNTLIGNPTGNAGIVNTLPNHCSTANCWDTGVVQIRATNPVPEPTSLLLLGSGMVGFAVWRGRQRKKNA